MYQLKWSGPDRDSHYKKRHMPKTQTNKIERIKFESYTVETEITKKLERITSNYPWKYKEIITGTKKIKFIVDNCHYSFNADQWEVVEIIKKKRTTRKKSKVLTAV